MSSSDYGREIDRARERLHSLEKSVWGNHERLRVMEKRLDELEPKVNELVEGQKIANAVAKKLHDGHVNVLTNSQRIAGVCVGVITVAASVKVFLGG